MIRLNLKKEPYWLELGYGVKIKVRPATTALIMAARQEASRQEKSESRTAALLTHLAKLSILEWEGVGDDKGEETDVTPENIEALMDLWPIAETFERDYLAPMLLLDAEKNV